MVGQPTSVTEFTAYNNGGSGANAYLYKGVERRRQPLHGRHPGAGRHGHRRWRRERPAWSASARSSSRRCRRCRPSTRGRRYSRQQLVNVVAQNTYADVVLSRRHESAPAGRLEREVQRLPRGARHDDRLEHAGLCLPRRCAPHGRVVRAVPRPEPLLLDRDDQRAGAQRELFVQAHDPRHPRQLAPAATRSRTATTSSAPSTRPAS